MNISGKHKNLILFNYIWSELTAAFPLLILVERGFIGYKINLSLSIYSKQSMALLHQSLGARLEKISLCAAPMMDFSLFDY